MRGLTAGPRPEWVKNNDRSTQVMVAGGYSGAIGLVIAQAQENQGLK